MIFILFATLIIVGGAFSASNYLENEILVRNKLFKQINVNTGYKNLLFFRKNMKF